MDFDGLLSWWEHHAAPWLRDAGLSPMAAAVLSVLTAEQMRAAPGAIRFTMRPVD